jgi:hypothetical protein
MSGHWLFRGKSNGFDPPGMTSIFREDAEL